MMRATGYETYGWLAPSVVSPYDETLQRLTLDHVEVPLTGEYYGFTDYYVLGIIEGDCNLGAGKLGVLEKWGLWG